MKLSKRCCFAPTVLVGVIITYLSLSPDPVPMDGFRLFEGVDKVVHGSMYLGLVWVGCYDLYRLSGRFIPWRVALLVGFAIGWGALMEYLQETMGLGRSADLIDFFANSCGALVGVAGGLLILPYLFRRYAHWRLFHLPDNIDKLGA